MKRGTQGGSKTSVIREAPGFDHWQAAAKSTGPAALIILSLPIVLVALNSGWMFSSLKLIDAWVNFGYFQHLAEYKSTLFPDLYYGTRLGWILPGYLAYHLFEPKTANYVLHLTFYYAATFSLYSLLKRAVGGRNALLGTVLFGTYWPFLDAVGHDYVDGAGITYFLLALVAAARATETRRELWLLLSGMAALAMGYTNLFLVVFLPFAPCLYLFMTLRGIGRTSLGPIKDVMLWFGGGAILISVVFSAINYAIDGNFWFYWPSIRWVLTFNWKANPWVAHGWAWLRTAYWLGIPAAATLASLVYVVREAVRRALKLRDYRTFFILQFLVIVCGMVGWQVIGSTGLMFSFYASYLIPSMFLAIGCLLAGERDCPAPVWWLLVAGSTIAVAWPLYIVDGAAGNILRSKVSLMAATALAAVALLSNVLFSRKWPMVVAVVVALAIYQLDFTASSMGGPLRRGAVSWAHVVEGARAVWPYEQTHGPVSFWYDADGPHGTELYSINAVYLWGYTYVGTHFPKVEVPARLVSGATLVMLADSEGWVEEANQALRADHFQGTPMGTYKVGPDPGSFKIGFLKLQAQK